MEKVEPGMGIDLKSLLSVFLEFRVSTWHSGPLHGLGGSHFLESMSFQYE